MSEPTCNFQTFRQRGFEDVAVQHCLLAACSMRDVLEIDVLKAAFPGAAFVCLFRYPLAVAASHVQQPTGCMMPGASSNMPWAPPHDLVIWNSSERCRRR